MEVQKKQIWTGKRHEVQYRATMGNVEAWAKTASEAKTECMRLAEESLTGSYAPGFVKFNNFICVWWREPEGWTYRITDKTEGFLHSSAVPDRNETFASIERRARLHLADYIGGKDGFKVLLHIDDMETYRHKLKFQEVFLQAKEQGMTHEQAHQYACEHC